MSEKLLTRFHIEQLLQQLGITRGSTVLLQADMQQIPNLAGGTASLMETILETIGPKGTLIVPAFTLAALDPASMEDCPYPVKDWNKLRHYHPGYSTRTMVPDVWPDAACAFLLHTKVKRTEHPVYSFAWLSPTPYKPIIDTLDYPFSYQEILKAMENPAAVNLLIGVDIQKSLLPFMEARKKEADITAVQSAYVRRVKKIFKESFLISRLSEDQWQDAMEDLDVVQRDLFGIPVYKVMHKTRLDSLEAADSRLF